jgi:opacity protein-like surface antigen
MKSRFADVTFVAGLFAVCGGFSRISAAVPGGLFVRPTVWNVTYSDSSFGSHVSSHSEQGQSICAGIALGNEQAHELSLEWASVRWRFETSGGLIEYVSPGVPAIGTAGRGLLLPVLANYRYYVGDVARNLTVFGGISVGMSDVSGNEYHVGSGVRYAYKGKDWAPTYGLAAGISWRVAPHVAIDVGYRYLRVKGTDWAPIDIPLWQTRGTLHRPDTVAHVFTGGLTLTF